VRIWPLYFLYVGLFVFLAKTGLAKLNPGPSPWPFLATFTFNLRFLHPHYALGHLWTLSVEEQFYIAWPFLVYFLELRNFRRLTTALVVLGPLVRLFVGALVDSLPGEHSAGAIVYGLTTSHIDAFAWGALLTTLPPALHERLQQRIGVIMPLLLGITALAGVAVLVATRAHGVDELLTMGYAFNLADLHQYVWAYTLLNASSAAVVFIWLVPSACPHFSRIARWFIWAKSPTALICGTFWCFTRCGARGPSSRNAQSPAARHRLRCRCCGAGLLLVIAYVAVVVALASASYYGFEQFFLRLKNRVAPETRFLSTPAEA